MDQRYEELVKKLTMIILSSDIERKQFDAYVDVLFETRAKLIKQ